MTVDDDISVYVGGLPYDVTEETLRRVFAMYGSIVAVKIVKDRSVRGKCYGFVTFTNPRSVDDAISGMDGKTIGGRVVRVNEVTTRGGRLNTSRNQFHHRERDYNHDMDCYRDRSRERNRHAERDRSQDHYTDKERGYEHPHDRGRVEEHVLDRGHYEERNMENKVGDHHEKLRDREHKLFGDEVRRIGETDDNSSSLDGEEDLESRRQKRELRHNSNEDCNYQVKDDLEGLLLRHEELQKEVLLMEERLDEKKRLVLNLQKQSKRLEDALISAKTLTSQRRKQLTKLHNCFLQVRECTEKLSSCEQELQSLVKSTMREARMYGDFGTNDEVVGNGHELLCVGFEPSS